MRKRSGGGGGAALHHNHHRRAMREKAKNQVDDLQAMFAGLQSARREGRAADAAVLEEQLHQLLREWKTELSEPSPAASACSSFLKGHSRGPSDLSSYIRRMLQLNEEEEDDDATSKLTVLPPKDEPLEVLGPYPVGLQSGAAAAFLREEYLMAQEMPGYGFVAAQQYKCSSTGAQHAALQCLEGADDLQIQHYNLHQQLPQNVLFGFTAAGFDAGDLAPPFCEFVAATCPPPSAFLRPKCALWDCPRPARGSEWFQDYCSSFHATLALNEGPPGMSPVLRPGGIDLKDGPLFAALIAKSQGKNVGIPECEGAATNRSPWNAPELFDLLVLNGESLREWLFFDKPRRAFESGNRKQRSLPDYNGRGWHESRKQVMKEFGGLKRSYYMDPQPLSHFEWHLYEYEINDCDACALYRLELKLVDPKKSAKAKVTIDSMVDLQQQMGRLNAENKAMESKRYAKGRPRFHYKDSAEAMYSASDFVGHMEDGQSLHSSLEQEAVADKLHGYFGT
ncbi:transcription factor VOZ1-like isoform X1 [Musa acuminata AAA Group]|uniref:transcription factor VOZ1-like isoform X1 n=1 Tax=Musa acuminata AAA Group TaxID=214697 RepID=UPI0031CE8441